VRRGFAVSASLAVVAIAIAVTTTNAMATATHDDYVAQVNPICKQASVVAKRKLNKVRRTGNGFVDYLLRARLYGKLLNKVIKHIATVPPAPGEETAVQFWLDQGRKTVQLINQLLHSFGPHTSVHRVKALVKHIGVAQNRAATQAANLGLTACAAQRHP
jgi:hypothetical protein